MKRIAVLAMGLLSLGLVLYAQEGNSPQQNNRRYRGFDEYQRVSVEKLSLSGTLGLSQGIIVLQNGEEIWYVPGLRHYVGFIDGLKDGAAVTLEGWGRKTPQTGEAAGFLRVSKLTLDGRNYEVGPAEPGIARGPGPRGEPKGPGPRDRLGPPEFHGWERRGRMGPMMGPGWGSRRLPEIHRRFHFRIEPKES
jgi:hypothetical protein